MSFDLLDEEEIVGEIADYSGICPKCGNRLYFIHDIRCTECDNQTIVWCPRCEKHRKLRL